jgi:hypothetical protein
VKPERLKELRHIAGYANDADLEECLDEIERLQGENKELRIEAQAWADSIQHNIDRANATQEANRCCEDEIARLRAALERIANDPTVRNIPEEKFTPFPYLWQRWRDIAREALEGR